MEPLTTTEKKILKAAIKKGRSASEISSLLGYESPNALNRTIGVLVSRGLLSHVGRKPNTYARV